MHKKYAKNFGFNVFRFLCRNVHITHSSLVSCLGQSFFAISNPFQTALSEEGHEESEVLFHFHSSQDCSLLFDKQYFQEEDLFRFHKTFSFLRNIIWSFCLLHNFQSLPIHYKFLYLDI